MVFLNDAVYRKLFFSKFKCNALQSAKRLRAACCAVVDSAALYVRQNAGTVLKK